jgi:peptidyl-prolyl cis-trans isomerase C
MSYLRGGLLVAAACVALSACHFPGSGPKQPTGQVVATVGDREVTVRDLNAELGSATFPDPKARKLAEQRALQAIVSRIVLANAAHEQGVDKTPEFAIQKQRALDTVLAQSLEQKLISQVPEPSTEEVRSYMSQHPDTYLERKIFSVDQIRMPRTVSPTVVAALKPLKTLEEVEALLKSSSVPYQRGAGTLDTVGTDPRLIDAILKLPPNEVFVIESGGLILVNQIKDSKVQPFTGDPAAAYAKKVMIRERTQEAISRAYREIMAKSAGKVRFNKDYAPPKPPPQTAAAANAAAPANAAAR